MFSIETRSLTKKYGSKTAVNSLDLSVNEGEIFALLGVNGAGKTTAVKMLSCLCKPSGGECFIMGKSCVTQADEVKKLIGISTQDTAVAENLTVRENLEMFCGIYGYPREKTAEVIAEMPSLFNMQGGQNQRAKPLVTNLCLPHRRTEINVFLQSYLGWETVKGIALVGGLETKAVDYACAYWRA